MNWYSRTTVNLHIDNHSDIIGRDMSTDDLAALFASFSVDVIQVSALGNRGTALTYQTSRLPHLVHPELDGYDMVGRFADAARRAGKRFFIYINTRGLGLDEIRPDWVQRDANDQGSGFRGGNDMCARPTPDGNGFLEEELLPVLTELTQRYQPDGYWVDGDHARLPACYCANCREAYRRVTGEDAPRSPGDSGFDGWMRFQLSRRDAYKQAMAEAVHRVKPDTLYCSNHSYRNTYTAAARNIDPRSAPKWCGYLSADLSHGDAVRQTRIMAMTLSSETETAHDIMHLVGTRVSPRRFLQQGALTIASGSPWFLWGGHTFVDAPEDQENVRTSIAFVDARRTLLDPSQSGSPIAVLAGESVWEAAWASGDTLRRMERANTIACGLQDAGYPVDLVNEQMLSQRPGAYQIVFTPSLSLVSPDAAPTIIELPAEPIADPDWDAVTVGFLRAAGIGPFLRVSGDGASRHLVFSLRQTESSVLLHITDLTTLVNGRRVLPSVRDTIDSERTSLSMTIALVCTAEPGSVSVAPESTSARAVKAEAGLLILVDGFDLHAVIELTGLSPADFGFHPVDTTMTTNAWRHYPAHLRETDRREGGVEHGHIV